MRFGSVCSGIDAASVAWTARFGPMDWSCGFLSEIEDWPSAALAVHFPDVPNYGDMTDFKNWPDHSEDSDDAIDLLIGGTPCQSFSIAGLRKGLDDPRGNLALTYIAIAARYRPRWLVWENVPGVLSSWSDEAEGEDGDRWQSNDFDTFIAGLKEIGYHVSWRILDAQFIRVDGLERAVPQRRRRLFVVGHSSDWRGPAAVLSEFKSVSGDIAPRRQTGKDFAQDVEAGFTASQFGKYVEGCGTLRSNGGDNGGGSETIICAPVINPSNLTFSRLRTDQFSEENIASTISARDHKNATDLIVFSAKDYGADAKDDVCPTLRAGNSDQSHANSGNWMAVTYPINTQIALRDKKLGESTGLGIGGRDDPSFTFGANHSHAVAFKSSHFTRGKDGAPSDVAPPLSAGADKGDQDTLICAKTSAACYDLRGRKGGAQFEDPHDTANIRSSSGGSSRSYVSDQMIVRRLTPIECERLQGFPDGYTNIPWRKKNHSPDGRRYKALGNSMAVNVIRWLGQRIEAVDQILEAAE